LQIKREENILHSITIFANRNNKKATIIFSSSCICLTWATISWVVKGAKFGFLGILMNILMDLCLALLKVKINGLGLICMYWVGVFRFVWVCLVCFGFV